MPSTQGSHLSAPAFRAHPRKPLTKVLTTASVALKMMPEVVTGPVQNHPRSTEVAEPPPFGIRIATGIPLNPELVPENKLDSARHAH
jgi:hypothetical protein